MSPGTVSIRDLFKSYRLYRRPADMLWEALTGRQRHTEFRALEGISFDIQPGTVLGVMGRNGAGKSTLLRIIAGTLPASGGSVSKEGRVAAILELGTGFHHDYTGRENVQLGGLCLGLSRAEIEQRFDEIVAFSELEDFIDRPFGTYSTGMQARLTFAVATCVDPDILIIDEALSVGDAKFQLKSFDRIRDFKRRGKSILLVSHSINQVVSICDRAILLERGRVCADADPNRIGHLYHELLFGPPAVASDAELVSSGGLLPAGEGAAKPSDDESLRETEAGRRKEAEPPKPPIADQSVLVFAASRSLTDASQAGTEPQEDDKKPESECPASESERSAVGAAMPLDQTPTERSEGGQVRNPLGTVEGNPLTAPVEDFSEIPRARGHRYGNKRATIVSVRLEDQDGRVPVLVQSGKTYRFVVDFVARKALPSVCIGFLIRDASGLDIIGTDTRYLQCPGLPERMQAGQRCQAVLELPLALAPGTFFFTMSIVHADSTKYDHWFDCLSFTVAPMPVQLYTTSLLAVPITSRASVLEPRLAPAEAQTKRAQ
jgi:lipopolysaccharide transport system ATP-binding protein